MSLFSLWAIFLSFVIALVYFGYTSFLYMRKAKEKEAEIQKLSEELDTYTVTFKNWDTQKTEFISIASHQLRTPLTAIQGYVELIRRGVFGELPGSLQEAMADVEESSGKLVALVESLLNVAQIEQGSLDYRFALHDFMDIVESAYVELLPVAESKQVNLFLELQTRFLSVVLDADKIRHAVFNFIENGIKYAPGGEVRISVEKGEDGVIFSVTDTGCGFESGEQALLFEKFYRTEAAKTTDNKGSGLGLYIARSFVEGHGGKIWSESGGTGSGSRFAFSIPLNKNSEHYLYSNEP